MIIVSESISFEGGNTYINGEGYLGEGIIFDGEIISGQKKGKRYDTQGNVTFEGEYKNGIMW